MIRIICTGLFLVSFNSMASDSAAPADTTEARDRANEMKQCLANAKSERSQKNCGRQMRSSYESMNTYQNNRMEKQRKKMNELKKQVE